MIVLRCANGAVLFRVGRAKVDDSIVWHCIADASTGRNPRTAAGYEATLRDIAAKAVALRGALLQIIDLPDLV